MIISRTPFRISLFGGGTDYPAWFREHGGAVLGTAINKYSYISVRKLPPFFEHRYRIAYSKLEYVQEIEEIVHPVVRGVLSEMKTKEGLEIHSDSDLPARSGLGSSSAFTVGFLHALNALRGQMITKSELGREAIRVEQEVLKEAVGCQDQLWAAFGGFNHIKFSPAGDFEVNPIILDADRRNELMQSVMMFFSGFSRYASDIAQHQIANMPRRTQQLSSIQAMVEDALTILKRKSESRSRAWRASLRKLASEARTSRQHINAGNRRNIRGGAKGRRNRRQAAWRRRRRLYNISR
jgi:D-glycero-alpha-D-manno-heptose-7-phosphate kinase